MKAKTSQKPAISKKIQAQLRNINEDFAESLNLPATARVRATLVKKAARTFETKIEVAVWRNSIFCHAIAETPEMSLQMAKRKIARLVSDLHDRKFVSGKHTELKNETSTERRIQNDIGAF